MLTPPASGSDWRWYANQSMAHGDWCATVVNPSNLPDPANEDTVGSVGIWFWGTDLQNFYTATITPDGTASVNRPDNGIWQTMVAPANVSSIKTTPGAANEVEVVTTENTAAFYINGSLVTNIAGHPPHRGVPGIYGESGLKVLRVVMCRGRIFSSLRSAS